MSLIAPEIPSAVDQESDCETGKIALTRGATPPVDLEVADGLVEEEEDVADALCEVDGAGEAASSPPDCEASLVEDGVAITLATDTDDTLGGWDLHLPVLFDARRCARPMARPL